MSENRAADRKYNFPYSFLLQRLHVEASNPANTPANTNHFRNSSFSAQGDQFGPETGNMSKPQKKVLNYFCITH